MERKSIAPCVVPQLQEIFDALSERFGRNPHAPACFLAPTLCWLTRLWQPRSFLTLCVGGRGLVQLWISPTPGSDPNTEPLLLVLVPKPIPSQRLVPVRGSVFDEEVTPGSMIRKCCPSPEWDPASFDFDSVVFLSRFFWKPKSTSFLNDRSGRWREGWKGVAKQLNI